MSKRMRPSLKDYLRTGVVRTHKEAALPPLALAFLDILSKVDRETWEPILQGGTELQSKPLDFIFLREDFRTMDRSRFTYYILPQRGELLRPVRSSVQIREPLALLVKWDEMGMLTLCGISH